MWPQLVQGMLGNVVWGRWPGAYAKLGRGGYYKKEEGRMNPGGKLAVYDSGR